eukprot:4539343-Pleurochrysis_carterae.AAC.8
MSRKRKAAEKLRKAGLVGFSQLGGEGGEEAGLGHECSDSASARACAGAAEKRHTSKAAKRTRRDAVLEIKRPATTIALAVHEDAALAEVA